MWTAAKSIFCCFAQIIGRLSANADNRPMPIVKWLIPIIGKLADNRPIPADYRPIIGAPLVSILTLTTSSSHTITGLETRASRSKVVQSWCDVCWCVEVTWCWRYWLMIATAAASSAKKEKWSRRSEKTPTLTSSSPGQFFSDICCHFNDNNNNNNNQICIAQVCRMTSEALDGQLQSCYTARARPKCLTKEKCF